jgi:hypothetical protein
MANTELLRDPNEPDIYGDMEQKIAARKLEKQQELSDLLKNALGKNKEVSPTQAFAASALAILPMIIGRHYAGTEGASIGAQVAGATAPKYAQTLGQPDPEEVAAATSQAKVKQAEIDALTKQEGSLMSNRLQGQREMARDERLYGEGGLRERYEMRNEARNPKPSGAASDLTPLQQEWLANKLSGKPTTPEQDAAAALNQPLIDRGIRAQKASVYAEDVRSNIEGTKKSRATTKTKDEVSNAIEGSKVLSSFVDRIQQQGQADPNFLRRNILQELPATEQGALQDDLALSARLFGEAITTGVMTDQDFQDFKGYFTIKRVDTPESILRRLTEFRNRLQTRVQARLSVAEAGGENVSELNKLADSEFGDPRKVFKQSLLADGVEEKRAEELTILEFGS